MAIAANSRDMKKLGRIGETCTCFGLRKAARAVTQVFDDALKPCGLRATQFTLLAAITRLGSATVSNLAKRLVMDRTTLTRNLKPLESAGWLSVRPGQDRRTRTLTVTAKGRQKLAKAIPLWEETQKRVVGQLGKKNWNQLMGSLEHVTERINPY